MRRSLEQEVQGVRREAGEAGRRERRERLRDENRALSDKNTTLETENCRLAAELVRLQQENQKLNQVSGKIALSIPPNLSSIQPKIIPVAMWVYTYIQPPVFLLLGYLLMPLLQASA